ncbi:MAG: CHAT domain-containing protein, partial [Myxococcota bacterium]
GAAGAIEVTADAVELSGSSEISVFAVQGPPVPPGLGPGDPSPPGAVDGNISIRTSDYLLLEDGSQIEASVDEGLGGSIFIGGVGEGESAEGLVLRGDSAILAQARTSSGLDARGGDISISANTVLVCPDCLINADGPTSSSAGSVVINNPETAIESQVVPPQVAYLDASAQLLAECGREVGGGRFTVANWPGLSISADEPLLQRSPSRSTSPPGSSPGNEAPTTPVPPNESPTADRAADLNAQGHAQVRAGDFAGALSRYRASAEQARGQKQELLAAQAEANAARVALILGENREAKSALGRARESLDQADASLSEEATLRIHLAESEAALAKRDSSQRVEGLLAAHGDLVRALEAAEESGERRIASHALGQLGALYGDEAGRDREAIHLTLRALRLAEEERAVDLLARYYAQLGALEWQSGNTAASLDATRRAVSLLEETRPEAQGTAARADAVFRQNVEPVYLALVDRLLQASGDGPTPGSRPVLLNEARYVVEQWKAAELRNYFHDSCAAELAATARSVESLDPHAAVIYPIALPDRLEILVSRASGIARITVPLSQAELEAEVETFRNLLTKRVTYDYEASARKLHTWLVDPYLPLLEEESIETLVFVPSGALRTIPMAALHDGDRFLVERFALALTPSLDLLAPKPLQPGQTDLLIAGVSEAVQGYPGLPGVAEEIAAIEALYGGTVLLDADFDPAHFEAALRNDRPGIVHLASHAEITGDPDTSFVLTHDGRLSIEELAALVRSGRYGDEPLELLVLSACETAISDERAALGLAGVAIRAGARSAMGSLWSVSDQAAFRLVASFYQALNTPGTSKARALQSAQKTLLADRRFQHPYYWASFLVMNNWL